MSMSILNTDESRNKPPLPPISTKRVIFLVFLGLVVFGACVAIALRLFPGPYRDVHYLMIGTASVTVSLGIIFVAVVANRRKMFVRPDDETVS